ncbi:hypothetical protein JKP88DRAFT_277877 [Tribonema minus]|uniref:Reverse transcriptase RNase H-like domain-containing protein n=1 Tax=Tribonema minus TaxID=303371 RepID=A0A835Z472_9STRA|nr:hypothetical protein JKP88DRAFT_277877 [Tribonema minus]
MNSIPVTLKEGSSLGEIVPLMLDAIVSEPVSSIVEALELCAKYGSEQPDMSSQDDSEVVMQAALPKADKARRWSQKEAEFIRKHVRDLHGKAQIGPSTSPWACNAVLVVQKGKMRFCIDYRKLNKDDAAEDRRESKPAVAVTKALHEGQRLREVVIGYYSHVNSAVEAMLAAAELECMALVHALNLFSPFVWGIPISAVTDAKALKWLLTSNNEVIADLEKGEMPEDDDLASALLVTGDQYMIDDSGRETADKLLEVTLEVGALEEIYTDNGHEFINKVAAKIFPIETEVAREVDPLEPLEGMGQPRYQWGTIRGFQNQKWRVRYDFGKSYEGATIRVMFSTGWSQGKLSATPDDVRAGRYMVQIEGEQAPREIRLRNQQYCGKKWAPKAFDPYGKASLFDKHKYSNKTTLVGGYDEALTSMSVADANETDIKAQLTSRALCTSPTSQWRDITAVSNTFLS